MKNFTITVDDLGVALVLFDAPGRTMNTFTDSAVEDLDLIVGRIGGDTAICGAVIASAKASGFCAGADLAEIGSLGGRGATMVDLLAESSRMSRALRALETVGKPVAAALEGVALGGGFELALACHHRAAARGRARVGLPEVTVGLLPGAGGTQRTPRLAGVARALSFMMSGVPLSADEALAQGLVDEVVEPGQAIAGARQWILDGGEGIQPWDRPGFAMDAGPYSTEGGDLFMKAAADVQSRYYGNYPARKAILRCVYEGFGLPMDTALRVEARLFLETRRTPQARAMVRTNFLSKQALAKGAARPAEIAPVTVARTAVLGAGMMGAGIAYANARAGIETVLIDVSQEAAERGRAYSERLVEAALKRNEMDPAAAQVLLSRIIPTIDYGRVEGTDLVIEAVFEDRELKAAVTRKAEAGLGPAAVFASNTSTLPITGLAQASGRPENFIGIHFFSPVERMELVEIIVGAETSRTTLAKAMDYCRAIRKVPIVVQDRRGFYTSRVFETYSYEGLELLLEGVAPAIIDNIGRMTGMPRGPLELLDDVALDLVDNIAAQRRADLGLPAPTGGPEAVLARMVAMDRRGRKNGAGFYDYPAGAPKRLWPGLAQLFPPKVSRSSDELVAEIKERLLFRQAVEAARCLDEGVVREPRDADVGAVMGWSFAPWTGGPASLIDQVGLAGFTERCDRLAERHGDRFAPPQLLRRMAAEGHTFYPTEPGPEAAPAAASPRARPAVTATP